MNTSGLIFILNMSCVMCLGGLQVNLGHDSVVKCFLPEDMNLIPGTYMVT